jgi:putative ABC transport system permease protein
MPDPSTGSGSPRAESRGDPQWARALDARLAALGVAPTRRAEIVAEVAQHLADARRDTLDPREAERLVRALAGIERRSVLDPPVFGKARHTLMSTLWQDIRYAARTLRLNPGYTAVVIATLALGIGANAAIFSVADTVMLRSYAYPGMDRIVALNEMVRSGEQMSIAWPTYQDWKARNQSFEYLGLFRGAAANLTGDGQPERLAAAVASSDLFGAMGIPPLLGRTLSAEDDTPGGARVAVISERLWRGRFAGDPSIVGRAITLNGEPHVIVGVMPRAMRFPSRLTDVWLPIGPVVPTFPQSRGVHPGLFGIARLKSGVSYEQAVADMDRVARTIEEENPGSNKNVAVAMVPYFEQIVRNIRPTLKVLIGAVGFVLLIGCANLANLMLARAERRHREIAVRAALGAERRRIVQQLLTESLMLAAIGGALGVLLAAWLVKLFVASRPVTIPRIDLVSVDGRVIAFAAALSIATGILFGLVPALRASAPDLLSSLKQGGRGGSAPSRRLRSALVVIEVALALVLVTGAGLMIRSFGKLMAIPTGFDPEGVVTMRLTLPPAKYADLTRWLAFHDDLVRRVSAIGGVTAAGINSAVPLEGGGSEAGVVVEGQPMPQPGQIGTTSLFQAASPDYFRAMGIALVRGRWFTERDGRSAPKVVIVDESLARKLFPNGDELGKRIAFEFRHDPVNPDPKWREIVGVVQHVRHYGIASEPPFVQLYTPLDQLPGYYEERHPTMSLFVRTSLPIETLTGAIRREVSQIDRDIPVYGIETMKTYVRQNTEQPRLSVILLSGLGALAMLLAVIGIYGVVSYSVAQRTQEIGVRMALGATRRDVLRMVVGQAFTLIAAGIVIGVAGSLALGSTLRSMLYEMSPRDPATLAAIAAVLAIVGVIASVMPARRATRVDPLIALRAE